MKSPGPNSCRKNPITLPNKNRREPSLCGMPAQTRDRRRCLCTHRKMQGMLLRCAEEGHLGSRLIGEENQKGTRMPSSTKTCRGGGRSRERQCRLFCSRSRRMAGEILAETGAELLQAGVHVLIHSEDDGGNGLVGNRFVVGIGLTPGDGACRRIVQLKVKRETSDEGRLINTVQLEQVATNDVIATYGGRDSRNCRVLATVAQDANQRVLNHIRGSFGPPIVFISAELHLSGTVDQTVIAIKMRGSKAADQQTDGQGGGRSRDGGRRNVDHVILNGAGRAAGGDETCDDGKNHNQLNATPGHSSLLLAKFRAIQRNSFCDYLGSADPGLCSLGEESRIKV